MSELEEFLALPDVSDIQETIYVNERLGSFVVKPMTSAQFDEYSKRCRSKVNKKGVDFDGGKFNLLIVAGQVVKPDFNNAELLKKAGCATASELIQKKLLAGEIALLSEKISEISGFNTDINESIQEAKN